MFRKIYSKLFLSGNFFTIAIKHREDSVLSHLHFRADYTVRSDPQRWCADPFLADYGEKTYLFYEAVENDLGRIEVAEVHDDCTLSDPKVVFSGETHFSYPYVFQIGSQWYMIPETSALGEVCLYCAEEFPYRWKKERVLLDYGGVDTTVFQKDDQWYLLTFIPEHDSERVLPKAYRIEKQGLRELEWVGADPLMVRGAGKPFMDDGELYRPVQVSTATQYGNRVAFAKIDIDRQTYRETITDCLQPGSVKAAIKHFDGLHTYSFSNKYETIDLRCRAFGVFNPIKKLRSKCNAYFRNRK